LSDQAVGVLVEAALPGVVGVGEVGVRPKQSPDELVVGELLAVVVGRGENLVAAIPMASRIADPTSRASFEAASQMSV